MQHKRQRPHPLSRHRNARRETARAQRFGTEDISDLSDAAVEARIAIDVDTTTTQWEEELAAAPREQVPQAKAVPATHALRLAEDGVEHAAANPKSRRCDTAEEVA